MKMKFEDWINFPFPIDEYIRRGSSIDGSDCPVVHPIGMAPQSPASIADFNLDSMWLNVAVVLSNGYTFTINFVV